MILKDATFLVTGGGSGLGAATVRELVRAGANCIIADVNEETGRALASEIGTAARFVRTDVTDEKSVQAAVDEAVSSFGSLRGAVNCAGIGIAARVLGREGVHDLSVFSRVIQINLIGTFNVIRLAAAAIAQAPPLDDGERGVIVNTASVAAFDGQIGQAAYSASKGGVVGMTLPIAREFAKLGIRVVTIAPGLFNTPMMASLPEEAKKSLGAQVPFPARLGQPSEYGALVRHIAENVMLNGETIRLDGAIRMAPK
jgi:NAD(P)-dependent dehydrogenase (short-subunit alcohol dehydrogenase family)